MVIPAIPATETALESHPCVALSSVQSVTQCNSEGSVTAIDQTFARSALVDLRAYLAQRSGATKWIISSDYLHDKTKLHDVQAYTIFAYDDEFANSRASPRFTPARNGITNPGCE